MFNLMRFLVLGILDFFDFFHKKKILKKLKIIFGSNINVSFDVGAHRGETIKIISKKFRLETIYAFEPLEKNFSLLKKNTINIKKKIDSLTYFNFALGNIKETKLMKDMVESSSSTLNQIDENSNYYKRKKFLLGLSNKKSYFEKKVKLEKAKSIIINKKIKKLDFLKIDTEGYEYNVIRGFEEKIKLVSVILFEHHYDLMINLYPINL